MNKNNESYLNSLFPLNIDITDLLDFPGKRRKKEYDTKTKGKAVVSDSSGESEDSDNDEADTDQKNYVDVHDVGVRFGSACMFKSRCTPQRLHQVINQLDRAHKKAIQKLGFGTILELGIYEIPSRFGEWIVDNFDHKRSILSMKAGELNIGPDEVHKVFGLPHGGTHINLEQRTDYSKHIVKDWRARYGKTNSRISATKIMEKVESSRHPDVWFMWDFLILFTTTMVEGLKNGLSNLRILNLLTNSFDACSLNWSQYIVDSMKSAKEISLKTKDKGCFVGPLCVITILYMVLVRYVGDAQIREHISLKNCDQKMLRARIYEDLSKGGYGNKELKILTHAKIQRKTNESTADAKDLYISSDDGANDLMIPLRAVPANGIKDTNERDSGSKKQRDNNFTAAEYEEVVDDPVIELSLAVWLGEFKPNNELSDVKHEFDGTDKGEQFVNSAKIDTDDFGEQMEPDKYFKDYTVVPDVSVDEDNVDVDLGGEPQVSEMHMNVDVTNQHGEHGELNAVDLSVDEDPKGVTRPEGLVNENVVCEDDERQYKVAEVTVTTGEELGVNVDEDEVACLVSLRKMVKTMLDMRADYDVKLVDALNKYPGSVEMRQLDVDFKNQISGPAATQVYWSDPRVHERIDEIEQDVAMKQRLAERGKAIMMEDVPTRSTIDRPRGPGITINEPIVMNKEARMGCAQQNVEALASHENKRNAVKNDEPVTPHISKLGRGHREKKAALSLHSPYIGRVVNVGEKISREEDSVCNWIYSLRGKGSELYFKWEDLKLFRADFESLSDGFHIKPAVVDAWSIVLNHSEQRRSFDSPLKFFCTTSVAVSL
uniref:Uncharacterized protein n=1 Tax=Kalanchoe fedtschenkoi TaxID=63787 RepID=A0A7N0U5A8_KALFE